MTGYEHDTQRYLAGEMTVSEKVYYLLTCLESEIIYMESLEHGLAHDDVAPKMDATEVHDILLKMIEGK